MRPVWWGMLGGPVRCPVCDAAFPTYEGAAMHLVNKSVKTEDDRYSVDSKQEAYEVVIDSLLGSSDGGQAA